MFEEQSKKACGTQTFDFRYSFLENLMDRGAWQVTVHRVTNCQT